MKRFKMQKWVSKAKPSDSAVDVARQVLEARLEVVWHYLTLAATKPEEDIEYVHQLRVATRRAAAACRVFRRLARKKRLGRLTKELRRLRRAAGMARDLDVLCGRLRSEANGHEEADLAEAVACVERRRKEVQEPLIRASRRWERGKRRRRVRNWVRGDLWRKSKKEERFGDVSHAVLASVVDDFVDAASADLSNIEALHQMRIQGKRLRYTIELVAAAFDKTLRKDIYPDFEEVQDRIGAVNDHATAEQIFTEWCDLSAGKEYSKAFCRLAKIEQKLTETTRQEFLQWWNAERSEWLRKRFQQVLEHGRGAAANGKKSETDEADTPTSEGPARV